MLTTQKVKELRDHLNENGYALFERGLDESEVLNLIESINASISAMPPAAGVRQLLKLCPAVRRAATSGPIFEMVSDLLGPEALPVRAILFDKTTEANWYVTWHQDLSIPVSRQAEIEGFGPWSIKEGVAHVQPPADILQNMLSVRIHLDDCDLNNGPIKFISGSHLAGVLEQSEIDSWKMSHEPIVCTAKRGDVILMRPLILHSSSKSVDPARRRVLHLEYANVSLPDGLDWAEA